MKNFNELSEHLERLAMAGLVSGSVVHELKSPLSIISICNEQILTSIEKGDSVSALKFSRKIEKALAEVLSIINSTRSLLQGDFNQIAGVLINELLDETIINCKIKIENQNINCSIELPENLIAIECNATQIKQVLINLIFNSIDAISSLEEKWIKIKVSQSELETSFTVTDSGSISTANSIKMFEPMYTTKGEAGTGVGLWLCKKIIEGHNGQIKCSLIDNHTAMEFSIKNT